MFILFKTVRYRNFLATGNDWTEIKLNENPLTIVYGVNGAGKTTFIDAITFALFGRAFRNINKPLLVNTINDGNCIVEIEFQIGNKHYKVIRGIKPTIFEIWCDSKLRDQKGAIEDQNYLEKEILKFNFKSFKQIVILGSKSFIPFMQLVAAERRSVIEDILYIQIFSSMAKTTKQKLSSKEEELKEIRRSINVVEEKIYLQKKNIEDNTRKNQSKIDDNDKEIQEHLINIGLYETCIVETTEKMVELQNQFNKDVLRKQKDDHKKYTVLHAQIDQNLDRIQKELVFFTSNDTCPTCKQTIDVDFKNGKIAKHACKSKELDEGLHQLNRKLVETLGKIGDTETALQNITKLQHEINNKQSKISQLQVWIKRLEEENVKITNQVFDEANSNQLLQQFNEQLVMLLKEKEDIEEKIRYLEVAASMLKDSGIKTNIIKQYLPVINNYINSYLSFMEFHVNFTLNEEFEESIMSRHRDEFSYESFSDGERLRIDLALLFAWRAVAKLKNSIDTNLLIMDEILDASYDVSGVDDFFKLIRSMVDINIFIISPKGELLLDKFQHSIKFEKKNSFSEKVDA